MIEADIHFWDDYSKSEKEKKFTPFLTNFENIEYLIDYFEEFRNKLSKKTLKSFLKSVSKQ